MTMTKEQLEDDYDDDDRTPAVSGSPAAIWLVYGDIDVDCTHDECDEVTWCDTDLGPSDVRYVRGDRFDVLQAEVDRLTAENERLRESWLDSQCAGKITMQTVRDCIGSGNCTCEARAALEQKPWK